MKKSLAEFITDKTRLLRATMAIKYICSALLALLAVGGSGESGGLVAAYAELAAIFCVSNMILMKWNKQGLIVNGVLLLL